jgi:hypothetical protein
MSGVPDYTLEDVLDFKFTTRQFSTGAPFAFASGAIEVYEDNSVAQITGAETLTLEFDGVTGLHNLRVAATAANGFENGKSYQCVVSVGTVDSVSVVGEVIQQFSIGRSAAAADLANATDGLGAIKSDTDDIQTRLPAALVGGRMSSDMVAVSGDSGAADNIEATYDGTGYTDDAAPSTQAQVGAIGSAGGGALSFEVEADNATVAIKGVSKVGTQTGTFTNTEADDGSYHVITHAADVIDWIYQVAVGGGRVANSVIFKGYLSGSNDSIKSPVLNVDELLVEAVSIGQTVGYALGRVWVNTASGTAGTEDYVNGTADNPSLTLADAITIAASIGLSDYNVSSDSTITLAADLNNANLYGVGYTLDFAGFDVAGSHFYHASPVDGIVTSANNADHLDILDSIINDVTVDDSHFTNCSFKGTVTFGSVAGDVRVIDCRSVIAGASTPIFDFGTGLVNHNMTAANWQNGLEIRNFNVAGGGTDLLSISGTGQIIIAASCDGGTINLRGQWKITDNSGGAVTITKDGPATDIDSILLDTADMQPKLGTPAADISADIAALNDLSAAEVNAEVLNVMNVDTITLPGQEAPPLAPTHRQAIGWLYKVFRNRKTQTATEWNLMADDESTVDAKATVSSDGTTAIKQEVGSGP